MGTLPTDAPPSPAKGCSHIVNDRLINMQASCDVAIVHASYARFVSANFPFFSAGAESIGRKRRHHDWSTNTPVYTCLPFDEPKFRCQWITLVIRKTLSCSTGM